MKLYIDVQFSGKTYCYGLLNGSNSCRLELPGVFIIDVFKRHNHLYCFKAFFYHNKTIYSLLEFDSKAKLHSAIQKMLQQELLYV